MLNVNKLLKENELEKIMTEYFKQDSKRPDFREPLNIKLKLTNREDPHYLLAILGIVSNVDDEKQKLYLLEKLVEELVLVVVGNNK